MFNKLNRLRFYNIQALTARYKTNNENTDSLHFHNLTAERAMGFRIIILKIFYHILIRSLNDDTCFPRGPRSTLHSLIVFIERLLYTAQNNMIYTAIRVPTG